jgi:ribosomal protein S18 acetylase RimI-like enzyme
MGRQTLGVSLLKLKISQDDLEALARLDRAAFGPGSYSAMTLRQFADVAGPLFSVARVDGKPVGYGLAAPTAAAPGEAWFLSLAVDESHRRQGFGRQLVQEIVDQCDELGFHTIRFTVSADNAPLIKLCSGFGFTLEDEVCGYYGPGEDRLVMVRRVE